MITVEHSCNWYKQTNLSVLPGRSIFVNVKTTQHQRFQSITGTPGVDKKLQRIILQELTPEELIAKLSPVLSLHHSQVTEVLWRRPKNCPWDPSLFRSVVKGPGADTTLVVVTKEVINQQFAHGTVIAVEWEIKSDGTVRLLLQWKSLYAQNSFSYFSLGWSYMLIILHCMYALSLFLSTLTIARYHTKTRTLHALPNINSSFSSLLLLFYIYSHSLFPLIAASSLYSLQVSLLHLFYSFVVVHLCALFYLLKRKRQFLLIVTRRLDRSFVKIVG